MGEVMQRAADGFTVAAVLTGLWAAWLWWRSGRVNIDPKWNIDRRPKPASPTIKDIIDGLGEMIDPERSRAFKEAIDLSSRLNGHAAAWTAASVALQAVATLLSRLAMP